MPGRGTVDRGGPSTIEDDELIERARNGDVPIWSDGATTFRMEGTQGQEAALGLARSMTEPGPP